MMQRLCQTPPCGMGAQTAMASQRAERTLRDMSLRWDFSTLADHLGHVISKAEADLRLEQAVYGLDAKDELALHAMLAEGLSANYAVAREVHYPSTSGKKLTHR